MMKGIKYCGECSFYDWEKCLICGNEEKLTGPFFDNCPLPDVEEVRHGYWIKQPVSQELCGVEYYRCSLCNHEEQYKPPYCPFCGAKMDRKKD
jgi:hypothetical protein